MNKHAILHNTDVPFVYGMDQENLRVILRVAAGDMDSVTIYYKDRYDGEAPYNTAPMEKYIETEFFTFYRTNISLEYQRYRYFFELKDKNGETGYYYERGFTDKKPGDAGAFNYPYLALGDLYEEVAWAQEAIVYQLFPDRFFNGNKENDPDGTLPWGKEVSTTTMFGGDLQGIIDKLDYLKKLGVDMIYFTPIFESTSNHKYNTKDYYKIDPYFGDIETAKKMVDVAHDKGIRIVFDGVFNHSGSDFFAFQDVIEKGEKSRYKDWYFINSFPIDLEKPNYITFGFGEGYMPKLNTKNPEVVDYFVEVGKYWIKEVGIDGWRLDVCDEIDHKFLRAFREGVKKVYKDAFIIGEIQHEGAAFLRGDQLDSTMNYPFRDVCLEFFAKRNITADKAIDILENYRSLYHEKINKQLLNLIDSHDTPRFITESMGRKDSLKLAAALQYTYIGIPYIYYGTEVGMKGTNDPYSRRCMVWDEAKQDNDLLSYYKKLNKIRKENKALVHGEFKVVEARDMVLSFIRGYQEERLLVVINNSQEEEKLVVPYSLEEELLTNEVIGADTREIFMEPMTFKIFKLTKE
ncbi:glycoside hydrolase family 13 protein [Alloiococcus sp. CFN-8]|uniref:glycoside hydrolase family 13 protein n=1 Tax=Alloiococcus sp. CFN-8 TaxID=3416081 RepID=UPI003CE7D525